MGLTILALEVANQSSPQQTETVEFLIDSGAVYSVVPRPILQRLGIAPVGEQTLRLAEPKNGEERETLPPLAHPDASRDTYARDVRRDAMTRFSLKGERKVS